MMFRTLLPQPSLSSAPYDAVITLLPGFRPRKYAGNNIDAMVLLPCRGGQMIASLRILPRRSCSSLCTMSLWCGAHSNPGMMA